MMIQTIRAVCFDLDDTLYPQTSWLAGAWDAVATTAARSGVDEAGLREALDACAAHGSDGGRIIDRALARVGAHRVEVEPLVETFRSHAPEHLDLYEGAGEALTRIAARVPLGLVSDGDPQIQRTKMSALGIERLFSVIVWSDDHGREHRKPDPLPFQVAVEALGVPAANVVYVGDRPAKDVAGAIAAGLAAIRVRTGEWAASDDDPRAEQSCADVVEAIDALLTRLDPH
jgi:putative hydrolase of the HAD superfamily